MAREILRLLMLLPALLPISAAMAQSVTFLPNQNMLPVGNVNQVMQDSEGYMWYATDGGGLCRDNGFQIDVFRGDRPGSDVMKSDIVLNIAEDQSNHIWIGSMRGLYVLDKRDYSIRSIQEAAFKNIHIRALCATHDGSVWVATGRQYAQFGSDLAIRRLYASDNPGDGAKAINSFYEDDDHRVWMLECRRGIQRLDTKTGQFRPIRWTEAEPICMTHDKRNRCYWVGTWGGGIVRLTFGPDGEAITERQPATGHTQLLSLLLDKLSGHLFAVTMENIEQYATGRQLCPLPNPLPQPATKKLLGLMTQDRQGNIWVAGYSPHTFIINNTPSPLHHDPIPQVEAATGYPTFPVCIEPEDDGLWLWLRRVGLYYYSRSRNLQVYSRHDYGHGTLQGQQTLTKCVRQPGIWMADGHRVMHVWMEGADMRWAEVTRVGSEILKLVDSRQGILYIGTAVGIERYNYLSQETAPLCTTNSPVKQMAVDRKGNVLYISPDNLLMECDSETGRITTLNPDFSVRVLRQTADGNIYIATHNGNIYPYDQQQGTFSQLIHFASNTAVVKDLTTDSRGHLWIAADQQLLECDPANGLYRIICSDEAQTAVDQFYTLATRGDSIFIGACGALFTAASSQQVTSSTRQIRPTVSAVIADSVTHYALGTPAEIDLPASCKMVEVQFTNFEYVNAGNQVFAYRIKELTGGWQYLSRGQNSIQLAGLSKGTYTIQFRLPGKADSRNVFTAITLHRLPAWWETWWACLLYALLAASLSAAILWRLYSRQKRKRAEQMEQQLQEMKFRFFTNISHELRTPLTLVITPLESLARTNERLQPILRNAYSLLEMINRLLDFRKLEMGEQKLNMQPGDIDEYVRSAVEAFRPLADKKHITLTGTDTAAHGHIVSFDRQKLHHILFNLLSNAIKYTPEGGEVSVSLQLDSDGMATIKVKDTGVGIQPEDLPHIFDRYYQAQNSGDHVGTGIGLNMVSEFAILHGGEVKAESIPGQGSTFTVTLLVDKNAGSKAPSELHADTPATATPTEEADKIPTVLIAEDNAEFREFLAGELSQKYHVLQAANGREALQTVRDNLAVNLIVSDVMMPEMDGAELCRSLKADVKTSHLPVILLTARSAEQAMLQGYEAGADLYLTKPFSMALLFGRIQHLLSLIDKRKQIFLQSVEVKVEDITANKVDEDFIIKAVHAVEKNLDNTEYAVEQLASDMCMSRMNLYRKLTTLTGQKPTEFIRTIRLKKAAQMIAHGNLTIAEVADRTGFATHSHFSRIFKEMFGVLPSEYKG